MIHLLAILESKSTMFNHEIIIVSWNVITSLCIGWRNALLRLSVKKLYHWKPILNHLTEYHLWSKESSNWKIASPTFHFTPQVKLTNSEKKSTSKVQVMHHCCYLHVHSKSGKKDIVIRSIFHITPNSDTKQIGNLLKGWVCAHSKQSQRQYFSKLI